MTTTEPQGMGTPIASESDILNLKPLPSEWYKQFYFHETELVQQLCQTPLFDHSELEALAQEIKALKLATAPEPSNLSQQAAFFSDFKLATDEGVALLCLAEALPRHPGSDSAKALIAEKLQSSWQNTLNLDRSIWANVSALGLYLTGKAIDPNTPSNKHVLSAALKKISGSVAQGTIQQAINQLGKRFIMAQNIEQAITCAQSYPNVLFNFDLLAPSAICHQLAVTQFQCYIDAIEALGAQTQGEQSRFALTLKLSSIYERFEPFKALQLQTLKNRLREIVLLAAQQQIPIVLETEESWRQELSLQLFAEILKDPELPQGYHGFGLSLQTYMRSTQQTLDWLTTLAMQTGKQIPIRLLKGTLAESEIIWSQNLGLDEFPIFTQKSFIDLSYLTAAKHLLKHPACFHPSFATHNPKTIASIKVLAQAIRNTDFELQYVFGLGEQTINGAKKLNPDVTFRLYSPIGPTQDLLPFLIRKLFENSSTAWFLNTKPDSQGLEPSPEQLLDPQLLAKQSLTHPKQSFTHPKELFQPQRSNSTGPNLSISDALKTLCQSINQTGTQVYGGGDEDQPIRNPAEKSHLLGYHNFTGAQELISGIEQLHHYWPSWRATNVHDRASRLEHLAQLLEQSFNELVSLCVLETAKTIAAAVNEVRQAINYCRLHAHQATELLAATKPRPGILGQSNETRLRGLGVFACISPSTSPIASLVAQASAALVCGNCVIAKPSSHGELSARKVAHLFYQAGFTQREIFFAPCTARVFSTVALSDKRLRGVSFAGNIQSAENIKLQLNQIKHHFHRMVFSTCGLNAMLVDSTVAPEQVIPHIVQNAFSCAGQLANSLNCVFIPKQGRQETLSFIKERTASLQVGNPKYPYTDVGPMITEHARQLVQDHIESLKKYQSESFEQTLPGDTAQQGYFSPPTVIVLDSLKLLTTPPPGPVLHIIPYSEEDWEQTIGRINEVSNLRSLSIYSKLHGRVQFALQNAHAHSLSINYALTSPAVGCQPCGGRPVLGFSLGNPLTLTNYLSEQSITTSLLDTSAPRY